MADIARIQPLNDSIEEVLKTFYSFDTPKVSLADYQVLYRSTCIDCVRSCTHSQTRNVPKIVTAQTRTVISL